MSAEDYVLPSSDTESDRLERQAGLYGGVRFLEPSLAASPRRVLDVGCGTGYFTRHVAGQLRKSTVVGLDQDGGRLALARSLAQSPNVRFERGDIYAMPFDDGSFDLVFTRFALVHATDPTQAFAEMARVTRAGGVVLAYDMVHDGIWFSPEKPAFSRLLHAALDVMRSRGMEPNQGLHLGPGMIRAGLADVEVEVIPHYALASEPSFEVIRKNWVDTVAGLSQSLASHFDEGLVEEALSELDRRGRDELVLEITVLARGRKAD